MTNPSGRGEYRQLAPILPSLPCNTSFEPTTVPHPGETVQEYLDFYGWSQRDLARRTALTPKTISEICNGKGPITPTTALAFEKAFQRPAHLWLNLQRQYASWAGLGLLDQSLAELEDRLATGKAKGSCLLCLGWGGANPYLRHHAPIFGRPAGTRTTRPGEGVGQQGENHAGTFQGKANG